MNPNFLKNLRLKMKPSRKNIRPQEPASPKFKAAIERQNINNKITASLRFCVVTGFCHNKN